MIEWHIHKKRNSHTRSGGPFGVVGYRQLLERTAVTMLYVVGHVHPTVALQCNYTCYISTRGRENGREGKDGNGGSMDYAVSTRASRQSRQP